MKRAALRLPAWGSWPPAVFLTVTGLLALRNVAGVVRFAMNRALEGDFAQYYFFARIGIDHSWGSLYDLTVQRDEWRALASASFYPAVYTPVLAWFCAPFAMLPFAPAYALWNILLVAALLVTWWLTVPPSRPLVRLGHLALVAALPGVAFGFLLGQIVIVVAAVISISWWLARHNRPIAAGLVLALIALKPQLALIVPITLLVSGRRRLVLGWLAGSLVMLVAALATLGTAGLQTYGSRLVATSHNLGPSLVYPQLTLPGLFGTGWAAALVEALVIALTLTLAWRRRQAGLEFPFAAGLCASMLVATFLHAQDVTVLLVAAWLWLRTTPPAVERVLGLTGFLAALLLTTPLPLLLVLAGWLASDRGVVLSASRRSGSSSLRA